MRPSLSCVLLLVVGMGAWACSKSAAKLGEACNASEGCDGALSCVSGTCFQLCANDSDCSFGECRTFTDEQGKSFNACRGTPDGGSSGSSGTSGIIGSSGGSGDTCYATPIPCAAHSLKSCATQNGMSCYYLVDNAMKVSCSGCDCQAAAQQITTSVCK